MIPRLKEFTMHGKVLSGCLTAEEFTSAADTQVLRLIVTTKEGIFIKHFPLHVDAAMYDLAKILGKLNVPLDNEINPADINIQVNILATVVKHHNLLLDHDIVEHSWSDMWINKKK